MSRLTDRGFYVALTLATAAVLAAMAALVPGVGSVLVVIGQWLIGGWV